MGIRGLSSHCHERIEASSSQEDLLEVVETCKRDGLTDGNGRMVLVCDYYAFAIDFLCTCEGLFSRMQDEAETGSFLHADVEILGGEPRCYDYFLTSLVTNLRAMGIELVMIVDGTRGAHPAEFERKLATLRNRSIGRLEGNADIIKYCRNGGIIQANTWPGIRLVRRQSQLTLSRLGVRWIQCLGEADEEIVQYVHEHKEVYAAITNDSDFLITPGVRMIDPSCIDWGAIVFSTVKETQEEGICCPVFSSVAVARCLNLPESALPSLAALVGNDITGPVLKASSLLSELELNYMNVQTACDLLASVENHDVRNLPVMKKLMQENAAIATAVESCLQFYSVDYAEKKLTWSLHPANVHAQPEAFLSFMKTAVGNGSLPPGSLSIPCAGVYWRDTWVQDMAIGRPRIMPMTRSFRLFLHANLRQKCVKEYGPTEVKDFAVDELCPGDLHFSIPSVDEAFKLSLHERISWYWRIVSHNLSPELVVEEYFQKAMAPLQQVGPELNADDHTVIETILLAGAFRYLISLNSKISKSFKSCRLKQSEVDTMLAMWFVLTGSGAIIPVLSTTRRPSERCVTLGQWFLAVLDHCTVLASRFRLSHFFPEHRHLFSGSLWATMFMAHHGKNPKNDDGQEQAKAVVRKQAEVLASSKCAAVRDFMYHGLPPDVMAVSSLKSATSPPVKAEIPPQSSSPPLPPPQPSGSTELPIAAHRTRILKHIRSERLTCIQGETGCGKSTSVPLYIYEDWLESCKDSGVHGQANIIVTQPRRVAAIMLARHVAEMRGQTVGQSVGYKVSGDFAASTSTCITYMTIGYLLQVLVNKPSVFNSFTHLVLDEVHERSADADLLSLVIHRLMQSYEQPKLVVMSATLQADLFAEYFSQGICDEDGYAAMPCPTLFVGVKRFNVRAVYLNNLLRYLEEISPEPPAESLKFGVEEALKKFNRSARREDEPLRPAVIPALRKAAVPVILQCARPGQCILVFVPGLGEILEMHELLSKHAESHHIHVFGLHSMMPRDEQEAAFKLPPSDVCHVILATNIAESSLTLPEVSYVIDFGLHKEIVFDSRARRCCLVHSWCSQASAAQRAGRTGRVRPGTVIRLYSEPFFQKMMPEYDSPEMARLPLDKLVLQVRQLADALARDSDERPTPSQLLQEAIQPPSTSQLQAAVESLAEVGALTAPDERAQITSLGRMGLHLPVDLSIARFLLITSVMGFAADGVIVAAGLSSRMDVLSLPSHIVNGTGEDFVESLWRSLKTRFHFDAQQYCEPLMTWRLFREWLRHRHKEVRKAKADKPYNRSIAARAFSRMHAVAWLRLLTLESLVADIASRMVRVLPCNSPAVSSLKFLSSLARDRNAIEGGSSVCKENPDSILSSDGEGLRCALVASFSFNLLTASSMDVSDCGAGANRDKRKRRDTTDAVKVGMDPSRTVIASNVPKHLRQDGGGALQQALPPMLRTSTKVVVESDKAFIECLQDATEDSESPAGDKEPVFRGLPKLGHLLCQLGGGRNRCFLPKPKTVAADRKTSRRPPVHLPTLDGNGATADDNSVTINNRNQPCHLRWRLVSSTGVADVSCNWRNPIGNARCSAFTGDGCDDCYAVAASIQGTERPGQVQASGVTVLPTESGGCIARFLVLLFMPHSQKVDFQLHTVSGDVQAMKAGRIRLQFEPPLPDRLIEDASQLRQDLSLSLDQATSSATPVGNALRDRLNKLLQEVRKLTLGSHGDSTDGVKLSRRRQNKARRLDQQAWKWVNVQRPWRVFQLMDVTEQVADRAPFCLLPGFEVESCVPSEDGRRASQRQQEALEVPRVTMKVLPRVAAHDTYKGKTSLPGPSSGNSKCLARSIDLAADYMDNDEFSIFLFCLVEMVANIGGRVKLDHLRSMPELRLLAQTARRSLKLPKRVDLLSPEFLSDFPDELRLRMVGNVCSLQVTEQVQSALDGLLDEDDIDGLDDDLESSTSDWETLSEDGSDGVLSTGSASSLEKSMSRLVMSTGKMSLEQNDHSSATPPRAGARSLRSDHPSWPTSPSEPGFRHQASAGSKRPVSKASFQPGEAEGYLSRKMMKKLHKHVPSDLVDSLKVTILEAIGSFCDDFGAIGANIDDIIGDKHVQQEAGRIARCIAKVPGCVVAPLTPVFLRSMLRPEIMCSRIGDAWIVELSSYDMFGVDDISDGYSMFVNQPRHPGEKARKPVQSNTTADMVSQSSQSAKSSKRKQATSGKEQQHITSVRSPDTSPRGNINSDGPGNVGEAVCMESPVLASSRPPTGNGRRSLSSLSADSELHDLLAGLSGLCVATSTGVSVDASSQTDGPSSEICEANIPRLAPAASTPAKSTENPSSSSLAGQPAALHLSLSNSRLSSVSEPSLQCSTDGDKDLSTMSEKQQKKKKKKRSKNKYKTAVSDSSSSVGNSYGAGCSGVKIDGKEPGKSTAVQLCSVPSSSSGLVKEKGKVQSPLTHCESPVQSSSTSGTFKSRDHSAAKSLSSAKDSQSDSHAQAVRSSTTCASGKTVARSSTCLLDEASAVEKSSQSRPSSGSAPKKVVGQSGTKSGTKPPSAAPLAANPSGSSTPKKATTLPAAKLAGPAPKKATTLPAAKPAGPTPKKTTTLPVAKPAGPAPKKTPTKSAATSAAANGSRPPSSSSPAPKKPPTKPVASPAAKGSHVASSTAPTKAATQAAKKSPGAAPVAVKSPHGGVGSRAATWQPAAAELPRERTSVLASSRPRTGGDPSPKKADVQSAGKATPAKGQGKAAQPSPSTAASHRSGDTLDSFIRKVSSVIREYGGTMNLSQLCGDYHLRDMALRKPFASKHPHVLKLKFFEKHSNVFRVERRDNQQVYVSLV